MPDPSEQSPERPDRPESTTPAPSELRRRVLARVRAEPEPRRRTILHVLRRGLTGRGRVAAGLFAAILIAGGVSLIASHGGGTGTLGSAWVARELGGARASLHRVDGHGELMLAAMPMAPIGEIYEVWLSGLGAGPRPTNALFNVTSAGTAAVEIPGTLRGVREITVTAEPVGGSSRPTSPVILSIALPGSSKPG